MEVPCTVKKKLKLSENSVVLGKTRSVPIQSELSFLRLIQNYRLDLLNDFGGLGPG